MFVKCHDVVMGAGAGLSSSIRVVASRTGIGPHTLRVWERRYGFPKPTRRPDGVRAYTEDDIAKLKLVARALEAGYRAGEVVPLPAGDLARLLEATDLDIAERPNAVIERNGGQKIVATIDHDDAVKDDDLVEHVIAELRRDRIGSVQRALRSFARAHGAKRFVTNLAHPLAIRIGELWGAGELDVRYEHLASACLTRQLHSLMDGLQDEADDEESRAVIVLATLSGEHHVLPLDMVGVYLSACGASIRMVGADTPPKEIAATARTGRVDAVGLSISAAAEHDGALRAVRELLGELPRRTALWLGGGGSASIASALEDRGVIHLETWDVIEAAHARMRAGRGSAS